MWFVVVVLELLGPNRLHVVEGKTIFLGLESKNIDERRRAVKLQNPAFVLLQLEAVQTEPRPIFREQLERILLQVFRINLRGIPVFLWLIRKNCCGIRFGSGEFAKDRKPRRFGTDKVAEVPAGRRQLDNGDQMSDAYVSGAASPVGEECSKAQKSGDSPEDSLEHFGRQLIQRRYRSRWKLLIIFLLLLTLFWRLWRRVRNSRLVADIRCRTRRSRRLLLPRPGNQHVVRNIQSRNRPNGASEPGLHIVSDVARRDRRVTDLGFSGGILILI